MPTMRPDPRAEPDDPPPQSSERRERVASATPSSPSLPPHRPRTSSAPRSAVTRPDPRAEPEEGDDEPTEPQAPAFAPTPAQTLARAISAAGSKSFAREAPPASVTAPEAPRSLAAASFGQRRESAANVSVPSARGVGPVVTNLDPRLERLEGFINESNWKGVCGQLGSLEESGHLPPTLGLVAAIAHSEVAGDDGSQGANELAIRCVASLFGVDVESPIGRVLAKRLLRKPPRTSLRQDVPVWFIAAALAIVIVGAGIVMWLLAGGENRLPHKFGPLSL